MEFLRKKLSVFELNEIHNDVRFFKEFIPSVSEREFNLVSYSNAGRSFASFLANNNLPQEYKKFVTAYNGVIKNVFYEDNLEINQILKSIGFSGFVLRDSFYVEDVTDLFNQNRFKMENVLEKNLYTGLLDWSDEWTIKRQQRIGSGICDLTIEYENEKVALELKKGLARNKDVLQAWAYSINNSGFKSILIASSFDPESLILAEALSVSCYEYCFGRPVNGMVPEFFILDKANEIGSETKINEELKDIDCCGGHTIKFFKEADYIKEFNDSVHENKKLMGTLIDILTGQCEVLA